MICLICSKEIFRDDGLKCTKCNLFSHFGCGNFREAAFQKFTHAANVMLSKCKCIKSHIGNNEKTYFLILPLKV